MKFAHIADVHIGGWREGKMRDLSTKAFVKAIDMCIEENVDFVIVAGDLFNASFPGIDLLKVVVSKFRELKDLGIPVYGIAGSHDFSPSGKTVISILEEAGLFIDVAQGEVREDTLHLHFCVDEKTCVKICGIPGKRGMLDRHFYHRLDHKSLEHEPGDKIFVFHTLLSEFKPKDLGEMETQPLSILPTGFLYYAGGHPHLVEHRAESGFGLIAYPGPIFPNSFSELEKLSTGGFYIYDNGDLRYEPVHVINVNSLNIDCNNKSPEEITHYVLEKIKRHEYLDTVVTLRFFGTISSGRPSDIIFRDIFQSLHDRSAYFVMKSTTKLKSREFEEIKVDKNPSEGVEDALIREHSPQLKTKKITSPDSLVKDLISALSSEKEEGEKVSDFEKRIVKEVDSVLDKVN